MQAFEHLLLALSGHVGTNRCICEQLSDEIMYPGFESCPPRHQTARQNRMTDNFRGWPYRAKSDVLGKRVVATTVARSKVDASEVILRIEEVRTCRN